MKVLVTGANGFLGSWLTRRLAEEGNDVHILVREQSDLSDLAGAKYSKVIGDVTNLDSLISATKDCEIVYHLAGVVAYTKSQYSLMEKVNVQGTANIIKAVETNKVAKLLHVSSVTAVGASTTPTPLNENSPYEISHLNLGYFETKRAAEKEVQSATQKGQISSVIVNPSTIYGGGDSKKGSRKTQLKIAKGEFPFFSEGGVNVVPVEKVVDGILKAVKHGKNGERYILSGENMTIEDLFKTIAAEAGVQPPKFKLPTAALKVIGKIGDGLEFFGLKGPLSSENAATATLYHWFDSSKAQKELGFEPGNAKEAIRKSVMWSKEHGLI